MTGSATVSQRITYGLLIAILVSDPIPATDLPRVIVSKDRKGFVLEKQDKTFSPWGLNYDHDEKGRLIEDYWDREWDKVERDFRSMKTLGANVVRVHLQVGQFMVEAEKPNTKSLARLAKLVRLAEETGLYLDLTGLGCYHKAEVPDWYDKLDERGRWDAQARFWRAVAETCEPSPAIFCYDLMNEPVVPGGRRKDGDWLGPAFGGKHFVQVVTLDQKNRPRPDIARQWVKHLTAAIRTKDKRHLITVGLVDWSLDRPGLTSGFVPEKIVDDLDFLCVHVYPEKGRLDDAIKTLKGFTVGKPVVIEETFPLKCSMAEFGQFIERSEPHAAGVIGFYWGKTPDELRGSPKIGDAMTLAWLEFFEKKAKADAASRGRDRTRNTPPARTSFR
jgi:hypothetical protein